MKFKCILKIKLFIYDKFIFFMIDTSFAWVFLITYMSDTIFAKFDEIKKREIKYDLNFYLISLSFGLALI
ncbi:hypothetical protein FL786_05800 [Campylobacter coli]|nr:hypothetical protein [Campylobacter coli]